MMQPNDVFVKIMFKMESCFVYRQISVASNALDDGQSFEGEFAGRITVAGRSLLSAQHIHRLFGTKITFTFL